MGLLRHRGFDVSLRWLGSGPLHGEARELVRSLGLDEVVEFPGTVPQERVWEEMTQANLFALPTETETFGVAFAEALGHGLPVVASGVGGHLGFLPPEGSRVAAERTEVAIADAIQDLVQDGSRLSSDEIVSFAAQRFDENHRVSQYRSVYRGVCSKERVGDLDVGGAG